MNIQYKNLTEMYSVELSDDGDLYLRVLIGGMAMSVSRVKMDEEMVAQFRVDPAGLMHWVRIARGSS